MGKVEQLDSGLYPAFRQGFQALPHERVRQYVPRAPRLSQERQVWKQVLHLPALQELPIEMKDAWETCTHPRRIGGAGIPPVTPEEITVTKTVTATKSTAS